MKCHTNISITPPTQLPHTFSYIVAILIHSHFESLNICFGLSVRKQKEMVRMSREVVLEDAFGISTSIL
jgi:hypothetical protein